MYILTWSLWAIFQIPTAVAKNITTVLVTRFISGAMGSTGSTMVGGTIADSKSLLLSCKERTITLVKVWITSERSGPMALFSLCAFTGSGAAPALMGYVAQNLGWRWIQYIQIIISFVSFIVAAITLRETRGSVILSKRARRLREESGSERYHCKADAERASLWILVTRSLSRPLWFLVTEPVVFFFSVSFLFSFC